MFKTESGFKLIIDRALYFARSYLGGDAYRLGKYLERHTNEGGDAYDRRLKQATFTNFCSPIIDAYISHLYKEAPTREIDQFDEEIINDIDFMGRDIDSFMRYISRTSGIEGVVGIIVDKPSGDYETRQQEIDNNIRPYCSVYKMNSIVNIPTYEVIKGRPVMTEIVLREGVKKNGNKLYKRWTRDAWELYEQKGNGDPKKVLEGKNKLGMIPFIPAKNRDSGNKFTGTSDIADIADINRKIYRLESNSDTIIENTAFPMLEAPDVGEGDLEVSPTNLILYDADNPNAKHAWLEPTGSSLKEIRADRAEAVADVWRLSKLGTSEANKVSAESGVALELRFTQLNALLSEKAESMEDVENQIFTLMAKWDNNEFTGEVVYPRKFGIRDLSHDIDIAVKASSVVNSRTFKSKIAEKIASQMLKSEDQAVIDKIVKEIEAASTITTDGLNA